MRAKRSLPKNSLLKKTLVVGLAVPAVIAGLLVGAAALLEYLAPHYREALAQRLDQRIDGAITIGGLDLRWGWTGPKLTLTQVTVTRRGAATPAVTARSVGLRFSYLDLLRGRRLPAGVTLNAPHAGFARAANGRLRLIDWTRPRDPRLDLAKLDALRSRLDFIHVHDARIRLRAAALPHGHAVLAGLEARLTNGAAQHWRIAMDARGPAWWPRLELHADLTGPLPHLRDVVFAVKARAVSALVLAKAKQRLGRPVAADLAGGRVDARVHGRWHDHRLAQARVRLATTALRRAGRARPVVPALTAAIGVEGGARPGAFRFTLAHISGALPGLAGFRLSGRVDTRRPALSLKARRVPGALAVDLARLRFPSLKNADIALAIDHLRLRAGANRAPALAFDFNGLTVDDPRLAFGPLGGHYAQTGASHKLCFDHAGGTLAARRYINGKLAISGLTGMLSWRRGRGGWQIEAHRLTLRSRRAKLSASGRVRVPARGAPVVDLSAKMRTPDAARLLRHLPQGPGLPLGGLREWLPKAVRAGALDSASLSVAGPLDRLPFAKPQAGERLRLTLRGHGLAVRYKPGWPALKNAQGRLTLDDARLKIALDHARMLGVDLASSSGQVADVHRPVLHVAARVHHARAAKLLAFLSDSPLKARFGPLVKTIDLRGVDDVAAQLRVPLKDGLGPVAVAGTATVHDNTLRQDALPAPITDINGDIAFSSDGLRAHGLRGELLGVALRAELAPTAGYQRIVVRAKPALPRDRDLLAHYLSRPWLDYAHGSASVRVAFRAQESGISHLRMTSDLAGLAIDLPAPLHKRRGRRTPLTVRIAPDARRIRIEYDDRLRLAIRRAHGVTTRVQALLGDHAPSPPDANGLWIGGHASVVDGLGWFYVVRHVLYGGDAKTGAGQAQSAGAASALAFLGGDLTIGALRFDRRYFQNTHIRAQPMRAVPGWRVNFEGANTQGQITWTDPANARTAIAGNLALLALKTAPKNKKNKPANTASPVLWPDVSPLALPRLRLYVQNFKVDDTSFGKTRVGASALAQGWALDRFAMRGGALTGDARARWTEQDGVTRARARADLDGHGLSRLLRILGYQSPVRAHAAHVHSRLTIAPNPNGLDLRALGGRFHLALDHGSLLSVNPGPGRLLGLFNLYVLPRRLRLDFRDVVDRGLAFDKVRADFNIRNGNAFSKNARIETPSSKITIGGRIGLAARDYNEHVVITPKIGSGAAIAGAVFGGPLIGAAVFAAQELLKKPIQQFSSIGYTLKGSWDNPTIVNPSAMH